MNKDEALKLALEALEDAQTYISEKYSDHILGYQMHPATEDARMVIVDAGHLNEKAINAIKAALEAKGEQLPFNDPAEYDDYDAAVRRNEGKS